VASFEVPLRKHFASQEEKMTVDMHRVMASFVSVKYRKDYLFHGPMPIVLDTGDYVWIGATYSDENDAIGIKRVGDTRSSGYDINGGCVLSVPAEWCTFHSDEEAHQIMECMKADEDLLAQAIG
jgi:hypothetical protein